MSKLFFSPAPRKDAKISWKDFESSNSCVIIIMIYWHSNNQIPLSALDSVISHHDPTWMSGLRSSWSSKFPGVWAEASFVIREVWIQKTPQNTEKHSPLLLNVSSPPVGTLISTSPSLIYWCRVVLHSSGIDIMLVKSSERFVDLSLTPMQFSASNFLITAGEHEFFPLKDTTWDSNVQLQQNESLRLFYSMRPQWKPWRKEERKKKSQQCISPAAFLVFRSYRYGVDFRNYFFPHCYVWKLFPEPQWLNLQILHKRTARVSSCPG